MISTIKTYHKKITFVKIELQYTHDVESRLGYFNQTGLFVDLFQGHILWMLFELLGAFSVEEISEIHINKKQYLGYGGDSHIDTWFELQFLVRNIRVYVCCGKKMQHNLKQITINQQKYNIIDLYEYAFLFEDVYSNNTNPLVHNFNNQSMYWDITEYINALFNKKVIPPS